jgi:L-asparagine transporter-like permease
MIFLYFKYISNLFLIRALTVATVYLLQIIFKDIQYCDFTRIRNNAHKYVKMQILNIVTFKFSLLILMPVKHYIDDNNVIAYSYSWCQFVFSCYSFVVILLFLFTGFYYIICHLTTRVKQTSFQYLGGKLGFFNSYFMNSTLADLFHLYVSQIYA